MRNECPGAVVHLDVGGAPFDVSRTVLLRAPYFKRLLHRSEAEFFTEPLLVDADASIFSHVISILRGADCIYLDVSDADIENLALELKKFGISVPCELAKRRKSSINSLRPVFRFPCSPGVHPDGSQFKNITFTTLIDERPMAVGRHVISFVAVQSRYLGVGVVPASFAADFLPEPHKTPGAVMFYMTGVTFTNGIPTQDSYAFNAGCRITLLLDMNEKTLELFVDEDSKTIESISVAGEYRYNMHFAVAAKSGTEIRIVHPATG